MSYKVKCTVDTGFDGPSPYTVTLSTNRDMSDYEVEKAVKQSFRDDRPEVTLYSIDTITKV